MPEHPWQPVPAPSGERAVNVARCRIQGIRNTGIVYSIAVTYRFNEAGTRLTQRKRRPVLQTGISCRTYP